MYLSGYVILAVCVLQVGYVFVGICHGSSVCCRWGMYLSGYVMVAMCVLQVGYVFVRICHSSSVCAAGGVRICQDMS